MISVAWSLVFGQRTWEFVTTFFLQFIFVTIFILNFFTDPESVICRLLELTDFDITQLQIFFFVIMLHKIPGIKNKIYP